MIEKLAINQGIIAPRFDNRKDENPVVTVPAINIKDIAPRTNKACQAYGIAMVRKPIETLSLDDCIRQLRRDKKLPGKDFILERDGRGFAQIKIKNLYGQPTKIINYQNSKPESYENRHYAGIQLIKTETHSIKNKTINKPYEKCSLNECISRLQKLGKIEGKGYSISGSTMGNISLTINDELGNPKQNIHFDNGNTKQANCWENHYYQNGQKTKTTLYKKDGSISAVNMYYNKSDFPQEEFTQDKLTNETTTAEYIKQLNDNNIEYEITDDDNSTSILEFNKKGELTQKTSWYPEESFVSRSLYNNEQETKRITFYNDETDVCTYINN